MVTLLGESCLVAGLFRTWTDGEDDLEKVRKIQAGYQLMPLHEYTGEASPPAAPSVGWIPFASGDENTIEAFKYVNLMLSFILPHELDKPMLDDMARLGIEAGAAWDTSTFFKETKKAIEQGIADALVTLDVYRPQAKSGDLFNTRALLKTNYTARALGVLVWIFGNYATQAVYLSFTCDTTAGALVTASAQSQGRKSEPQKPSSFKLFIRCSPL